MALPPGSSPHQENGLETSATSPKSSPLSEILPEIDTQTSAKPEDIDAKPALGEEDSKGYSCWLMKAEPDTRIVKGKDVAFSVDHFEALGRSQWDGVRNALAGKYMKKDMRIGDKVLFYHSNCKVPGVAALAEVVKEGYPDYSAWDPDHPYYDPKTKEETPKWFMVDVEFKERLPHLVPLSLYKNLANLGSVPAEIDYISPLQLAAIKAMPLINSGRLSVQTVSKEAYEATVLLGRKGGFDELAVKAKSKGKAAKAKAEPDDEPDTKEKPARKGRRKAKAEPESSEEEVIRAYAKRQKRT